MAFLDGQTPHTQCWTAHSIQAGVPLGEMPKAFLDGQTPHTQYCTAHSIQEQQLA